MSTIKLSALKSMTAGAPPTMQSQNGIDRGKFCRAWVSFGRKLGDVGQYEVMSQFNVMLLQLRILRQDNLRFNLKSRCHQIVMLVQVQQVIQPM